METCQPSAETLGAIKKVLASERGDYSAVTDNRDLLTAAYTIALCGIYIDADVSDVDGYVRAYAAKLG